MEVTPDGHVTRMRGQLLEDPEAVAPLYARAIGHFGVKRAQRMLGVKIHTPVTPATEALAEAARCHHLSAIRLTVKPDPDLHAANLGDEGEGGNPGDESAGRRLVCTSG